MSQHDGEGHRERLRERFLQEGLEHFQDHEVLEFLLTVYIPRVDTKPVAKRLLGRFGSLYRVLEASPEELMRVQGVGRKTAFALNMLPAVFRRYELDRASVSKSLLRRHDMGEYCRSLFVGERYEVSRIVLLNNGGRLLHEEAVARGTIDQVPIYARNAVELALRHDAKYAVIAHNHPGGSREPSAADVEVTAAICRALEGIDVQLLDHIIVTRDGYVSVREFSREQAARAGRLPPDGQSPTVPPPYPNPQDKRQAAEKGKNG